MPTVRELALMLSSDVRHMHKSIERSYPIKEKPEVPVTDVTPFPVRGQCNVPTVPVYISPVVQGEGKFTVNPLKKLVNKVAQHLPGEATGASSDIFYTPSADLTCWQTIDKEKIPGSAHRETVIGEFEVWLDSQMPNGATELTYDAGPLLRDFLLRADSRNLVRDECIAAGYSYLTEFTSTPTTVGDTKMVMAMTRLDCAAEFDFATLKWNFLEAAPEMSQLYNITQLKNIVVAAKSGQATYTGEQLAKIVMATQDGVSMMADKYMENLESLLSVTRFKLLHPLDTVGYFLRYSATSSVNSVLNVHTPSKDYFPVFLHDTVLDAWSQISNGFASIPKASLPPNREVAGIIGGVYEVVYDKDARDTYTYEQIAWLMKVVMSSPYMPNSESLAAMYGCMSYLTCALSSILDSGSVESLVPVPGTRIADNSPQDPKLNQASVAFCLNTPRCRTHLYSSDTNIVRMTPGRITTMETSIMVDTDRYIMTPEAFCNMLSAISDSGVFANWEANLNNSDDLGLVDPGPKYKAFYAKAPHIYDPFTCVDKRSVYIDVEGHLYCMDTDGSWADALCETDVGVARYNLTKAFSFFCGTLYFAPNAENVTISPHLIRNLLVTTAKYFVSFELYPTVYSFLYNFDKEAGTWMQAGVSSAKSRITFGKGHAFTYDIESNLWDFKRDCGYASPTQMGPVCISTTEGVTIGVKELGKAMLSLSSLLPSIEYIQSTPHPKSYNYMRFVPKTCDDPKWTVKFGNINFTSDNGDWAVCSKEVPDSNATVSSVEFIALALGYLKYIATYEKSAAAYSVIKEMLGQSFENLPALPVTTPEFIFYINEHHVWTSAHGCDDGVGLEDYTTEFVATGMNAHYIHFALVDGRASYTIQQVLSILKSVGRVDEIFDMYADKTPSYDFSQITDASENYARRVSGRIENIWKNVQGIEAPNIDKISFVFAGADYCTGFCEGNWYKCEKPNDFEEVADGVYVRPDMVYGLVSAEDCKNIVELYMTMHWDSWKDAWYGCILEESRQGRLW